MHHSMTAEVSNELMYEDVDPAFKQLTLDLFTEIAILEHLVRNREPEVNGLTAAQFGILNYFCRLGHKEARISFLAWCFQESEARIAELTDSLRANGLIAATQDNDPCITITDAGRAKHEATMKEMAPDFLPIVQDIPREDLEVTVRTLMELRRTLDNLPDRSGGMPPR
jgi:DNA-binding MarR family transcriptional regulator